MWSYVMWMKMLVIQHEDVDQFWRHLPIGPNIGLYQPFLQIFRNKVAVDFCSSAILKDPALSILEA